MKEVGILGLGKRIEEIVVSRIPSFILSISSYITTLNANENPTTKVSLVVGFGFVAKISDNTFYSNSCCSTSLFLSCGLPISPSSALTIEAKIRQAKINERNPALFFTIFNSPHTYFSLQYYKLFVILTISYTSYYSLRIKNNFQQQFLILSNFFDLVEY